MKVKKKALRIADLARETGVSRRLLRDYEEQGLRRPARLGNGYRDYADELRAPSDCPTFIGEGPARR
ncbi:MerR family DNA-binding transcriptional regulator [Streptomyces niveus]|uniref:MerR family DNA-binding transcriptional regulator n=1 Tax=Streptomyces niveus TaxID=193462 RepID=UPI0036777350